MRIQRTRTPPNGRNRTGRDCGHREPAQAVHRGPILQQSQISVAGCVLDHLTAFPTCNARFSEPCQAREGGPRKAVTLPEPANLGRSEYSEMVTDNLMLRDFSHFARVRNLAARARMNRELGSEFHRVRPSAIDERISNQLRLEPGGSAQFAGLWSGVKAKNGRGRSDSSHRRTLPHGSFEGEPGIQTVGASRRRPPIRGKDWRERPKPSRREVVATRVPRAGHPNPEVSRSRPTSWLW